MNKEEIKDYITELESVFELSELEEHRINILKVGIYINQLQQENQKYKEVIDKAINDLDIIIDIVREQPFGDRWIINRLEANKNILKEVE